ncbi:serine-rich adhesin for platelets-like isoform X2 [Mercenaria mercenaria]|uniref:serine-rich adhesin for platelets-like isoform X2 n=1 Tax=Mercenaria mercenaria TaxID=6596 RepID=UPI00234E56EC|nr:serine-rich adhesin for platelets-like isoform X2 [Mercenaria mercenaria]
MRITLAVSFLVTCIRFSREIPVKVKDRLDVNFTEGVNIISPGYENGSYPYDTEKFWELYAPHAMKIKVVFEDFDIEYHPNCAWDNVSLVRSKCEHLTAFQTWDVVLCGPLQANTFDFDSSPICMMFTSDWYINKRGFKAHAIAIPDSSDNKTLISTSTASTSSVSTSSVSTSSASTSSVSTSRASTSSSSTSSVSTSSASTFSASASSDSTSSVSTSSASTSSASPSSDATSSASTSSGSKSDASRSSVSTSSASTSNAFTSFSKTIEISSSSSTPQHNIFSSSATLDNTSQKSSLTASQPQTPPSLSLFSSSSSSSPQPLPPQTSSSSSSLLSPSPPPPPETSSSSSSSSSASSSTSPPPQISSSRTSSSLPGQSKSTAATSMLSMDVVMCEFIPSSIDIGPVHKVVVLSPKDENGDYYPRNKHCALTLNNPQLQDMDIEFKHFEIENSHGCGYDYLEIKEGEETPYRLCGTTIPDPWSTKAETIKLVFHSDQFIRFKGFEMEFTKLSYALTTKYSSLNETAGQTEATSSINERSSQATAPGNGTDGAKETTFVVNESSSTDIPSSKGTDASFTKTTLPAFTSSTQKTEEATSSITTTQSLSTSSSLRSSTKTFTKSTVFTTLISKLQSSQSWKATSSAVKTESNEKASTSVSKESWPSSTSTLKDTKYSSTSQLPESIFSTKPLGSSLSSQSLSSVISSSKATMLPPAKTEISTKPQTSVSSTASSTPSTIASVTSFLSLSSSTSLETASATVKPTSLSQISSTASTVLLSTTAISMLSMDVVMCEVFPPSIDIGPLHKIVVLSPKEENKDYYPLNKHCALTLNNHQLQDIEIEFKLFEIENGHGCGYDYLEIKEGEETPYRLCGTTTPDPWSTKAETIKLVFHSDQIIRLKGFEMEFSKNALTTESSSRNETKRQTGSTEATSSINERSSQATTPGNVVTDGVMETTFVVNKSSSTDIPSSKGTDTTFINTMLTDFGSSTQKTEEETPFKTTTQLQSTSSSLRLSTKTFTTSTVFTILISKLQSSQSWKATSSATKTESTEKASTPVSRESWPSSTSTLQDTKYSSTSQQPKSIFSTKPQGSSLSSQSLSSVLSSSKATMLPPAKTEISTKPQTASATTHTPLSDTSPTISTSTKSTTVIQSLDVIICEYAESSLDALYMRKIDIRSPKDDNDGERYPVDKYCELFIDNKQHLDVDIVFPKFDIEYHPECEWDYLQLKFGDKLPITMCGSHSPENLTTSENVIEIVFHSDHIVPLSGFEMQLTIHSNSMEDETQPVLHSTTLSSTRQNSSDSTIHVTPSTSTATENFSTTLSSSSSSIAKEPTTVSGGFLMKEDEVLMTPDISGSTEMTTAEHSVMSAASETTTKTPTKTNTPSSTITYTKKSTLKSAPENTHPESTNAVLNFTTTTQKSTSNETNTFSSSEKSLISTTKGAKSNSPVGSTATKPSSVASKETASEISPSLKPTTQSDAYLSTAENKQTTLSSAPTNTPSNKYELSTSTVNTPESAPTGSSVTSSTAAPEDACSLEMMPAVMDEEFGYISSPGFDDNDEYPAGSTCQWVIKGEINKVTMVIFKYFDIESSNGCIFDSLVFYETSNNGEAPKILANLCGSNIPGTFSTNNSLLVEFKSDSMQQRAGFRFQFIRVQSVSGMTHSCPPGKIPCASSGVCIPVEWWCDDSIDCNDNTDEMYCPKCLDDQLQCGDGVCLSMANRCDGIQQCSYGTDEQGCVSESQIEVENSMQVNINGAWLPLCYGNATIEMGDDICKAAGYRSVEQLTGETVQDQQLFSVAISESGNLTFNKSSACQGQKIVHLQCSDSECGRKGERHRKKRIIGGSLSSKGEWPWSVAIRSGNSAICGGSVIDSMWILTAGHCVKDLVDNPQILSIVAGVNDINDADRQIRYVSEVVLHPNYHYIFNADIAVLRLQRPLNFDNHTKSICLPWDKRQFSPSDLCYVTGYGVSDMKDYYTTVTPKFLRHVKTKIIDLDKCKDIYSTRYSNSDRIKDNMLCAGYTSSGMDACKGDSGGGLMCRTTDDRWLLAGVVSWGDLCGSTNRPGVYTNVVSFMDWIAETTTPNGVKNVTCDFETDGWCGYTDISTGSYVWTRKPGDKYIKGTILHATRTYSTGNNGPVNASLLTPTFNTQGEACLSFSFMFSGNSNITLSVFGIEEKDFEEHESELLWRITSHYPAKDSWKSTEVTVPITYNRLMFVSLSEHGGIIGLGLDNISLSTGQCVGLEFLSCKFNDGNTCSYEQHGGLNSNTWTITPEVTVAAMQGKQDFYIKAGGDFNTFGYLAMSQLVSPELGYEFTSIPHCVAFSFNKKTQTKNDLVLATYVTIGSQMTNQKIFWSSEDAEVEQWRSVRTTIHNGIYDHIVFEVQRKEFTFENIEILLDDIHVTDGVCVT